ncbi:MAG: response regulator transcription factor [Verrucomicrobia bacterium]|nr:response regulator transcription factor [Verrucomicrobiota bacterium]MCH8512131.1 LuxR C-terminal-related transcriptional regulator [Kiritimatiellia bacterium]
MNRTHPAHHPDVRGQHRGLLVVEPRALWREGMIALIRARLHTIEVVGMENWNQIHNNVSGTTVVISSRDWVHASLEDAAFRKIDFVGTCRLVCIGNDPIGNLPGSWTVLTVPEHAEAGILLDMVCANWRQDSLEAKCAKLTVREREVVRRLCDGESFKQVADELQVGISTVQSYKKRAMEKLQVASFAELCRVPAAFLSGNSGKSPHFSN